MPRYSMHNMFHSVVLFFASLSLYTSIAKKEANRARTNETTLHLILSSKLPAGKYAWSNIAYMFMYV